ncbi:MAG: PsiF family protein [Burkholderiaceae bacterium]|nr:PsiF family protein [Burkholderiaceae bacterium]
MKTLLPLITALSLACGGNLAHAASGKPLNSQQQRMAACNKQATGKKGDERKAFMKQCLRAHNGATQQEKMKICNQQAGAQKGDERKAFMKACLSKSA